MEKLLWGGMLCVCFPTQFYLRVVMLNTNGCPTNYLARLCNSIYCRLERAGCVSAPYYPINLLWSKIWAKLLCNNYAVSSQPLRGGKKTPHPCCILYGPGTTCLSVTILCAQFYKIEQLRKIPCAHIFAVLAHGRLSAKMCPLAS